MGHASVLKMLQDVASELQKGRLPSAATVKLLISKALGFAILAFSCVVKVPQISAISQSKSAEGLAPISYELEQVGLIIHTAYGYLLQLPFNIYGEAAIICLQNTYLLAQIYFYTRAPLWRFLCMALLITVATSAVVTGRVNQNIIRQAYDLNNVIFLAARVPQIYKSYKAKDTGQLSVVTALANFAGCIARIFTSLQEGGGMAMVRGYLLGTLLNGTIFFQILYYGSTKRASQTSKKKVK